MSNNPDPSNATSGPSTRRSTRPKRFSDTPKPRAVSPVEDSGISAHEPFPNDRSRRRKSKITQLNPRPWMHPQELRYIDDVDFSQTVIIRYLCSKAFSIPSRETNSNVPLFYVTTREGKTIGLPRGYRVPLMFVARFQWDSLKLVLTASDPEKDWNEHKFDIIHLCRLCERLFAQATDAQDQAVAAGTKGIDRFWRSATFDRVLTRFYHHWFVSRERYIRKFWKEFGGDEYDSDVLKRDWSRWSLKGYRGFALTKEDIQDGIAAQEFMRGLMEHSRDVWVWREYKPGNENIICNPKVRVQEWPLYLELEPYPPTVTALAQLEKVFDRTSVETPSHNTIEVKKERFEFGADSHVVDNLDAPSSGMIASTVPTIVLTDMKTVVSTTVDMNPAGAAERSTSPTVGQKRPREHIRTKYRTRQAQKTAPRKMLCRKTSSNHFLKRPELSAEKSFSFGGYLEKFKEQAVLKNAYSSSESSEESDDPDDSDYRGPRNSKPRLSKMSAKSNSTTNPAQICTSSPTTVIIDFPKQTTGPLDRLTRSRSINDPSVVAAGFSVLPKIRDSPGGAPSSAYVKPLTLNLVGEPELPSCIPAATQSNNALSSDAASHTTSLIAEGLSVRDVKSSSLPAVPLPNAVEPTFDKLSNSGGQDNSTPVLNSLGLGTPADQFNPSINASETTAVRESEGVVTEDISDSPAAENEVLGAASSNFIVTTVGGPNSSNSHGQQSSATLGLDVLSSKTVANQITQSPENVSNLSPAAEIESSAPSNIATAGVVGDRPSNRSSLLKSSADAGPSAMDTSPLNEDIPPGFVSSTLSSVENDCMEVDDVPTKDLHEDFDGILASFLSDPRQIKVRHAVHLLRGLLRDQQIRSRSIHTTVDSEDTLHFLSPSDPSADGDEPFTGAEHLELIVKCSSFLSKYVTAHKGQELEERMIELDERLRQVLSDMEIAQIRAMESNFRVVNHSPVRVDKEVATMIQEGPSGLLNPQDIVVDEHVENLGSAIILQDRVTDSITRQSLTPIKTMGDDQVKNTDDIITQDPVTDTVTTHCLTPEATMVDLSVPPTTLNFPKMEPVSGTITPATRLMVSMMRDFADLLDCTRVDEGNDAKGKGRASDVVTTADGTPFDFSLLHEYKSMKEEIWKRQRRREEEIESIAGLHRAELTSLKKRIRVTEDKYRRETELLGRRHREEMDLLMSTVCELEKRREQIGVETEGKLPSLEILELRRRIAALENHTRSLTHSQSQAGRFSRPVCDDESNLMIIRRAPFHPLGHLFDYEDATLSVPYRPSSDGIISVSKEGTPVQSESSNTVFIDSIPLPIKSQRKFQSMHRMNLT